MTSQLERLRRLQGLRQQKRGAEPTLASDAAPSNAAPTGQVEPPLLLEEAVAGEVVENHAGACYVVTRRYGLAQTRGIRALGALLEQTPAPLAALHPAFGLHARCDFLSAAFIDTETTGLGGGASVYAFMVGVGIFEPKPAAEMPLSQPISQISQNNNPNIPKRGSELPELEFVVRQFFMRSPAEEGALLVALSELLADREMTVTFNGRTFDLPLLRTRYQFNHWLFPAGLEEVALLAPDRPHLDLLHPARRLWRRRLKSCRLINLEERVLGLLRTEQDVPGALIPQLYVDYTRTRDARQMARVFYHNCEDIVSMVSLADVLAHTFGLQPSRVQPAELPGVDWLALGDTLEGAAALDEAECAFRHAIAHTRDAHARAEAYAKLGRLLKRQSRWTDAAEVWQQWLGATTALDAAPYIELAKYCEWQTKDLEQAAMWTGWALHNQQSMPPARQDRTLIADLQHRLSRIRDKQRRMTSASTP